MRKLSWHVIVLWCHKMVRRSATGNGFLKYFDVHGDYLLSYLRKLSCTSVVVTALNCYYAEKYFVLVDIFNDGDARIFDM